MNLQEHVINDMAKQISQEIDFEILAGMLVELGWTRIVLAPMTQEQSLAVDGWIKEYCKSPVETMGLVWLFEDSKEANWFALKWL